MAGSRWGWIGGKPGSKRKGGLTYLNSQGQRKGGQKGRRRGRSKR